MKIPNLGEAVATLWHIVLKTGLLIVNYARRRYTANLANLAGEAPFPKGLTREYCWRVKIVRCEGWRKLCAPSFRGNGRSSLSAPCVRHGLKLGQFPWSAGNWCIPEAWGGGACQQPVLQRAPPFIEPLPAVPHGVALCSIGAPETPPSRLIVGRQHHLHCPPFTFYKPVVFFNVLGLIGFPFSPRLCPCIHPCLLQSY